MRRTRTVPSPFLRPTARRLAGLVLALALLLPVPLLAQAPPEPPLPPITPPPPLIFIDGAHLDLLEAHLDVRDAAAIARYRLHLTNPGELLAEGRIVVPVPPRSAVTDLVLSGGPETLEGRLLNADDAERIYQDIVRRLIDPALLQALSDTLYEVRAFPVPPGETRSVSFTVTTPLTADGDQVRVALPWSRMSPQPARAAVTVDIDVSWEVRAAVAPTYSLDSERRDAGRLMLSWESASDWIPSADFTLYLGGGEGLLTTQLLAHRPGDEDGYFTLLFAPDTEPAARVDRDVVIVLDISGSMEGDKLHQAQDAAAFILEHLGPDDRFAIVAFSRGVEVFGGGLHPAQDAPDAAAFVDDLRASGGTNIAGAVGAACDLATGDRPATVVFLTDGLPTVGPEDVASILSIAESSARARTQMFTFGVGFDVDTILLDSLAAGFLGTSHYVTPDETIDAEVGRLFERIATPVLTDVEIDFQGGGVHDLGPERITGIFAGTQVLLTGRYADPGAATVTVRGDTAAGRESFAYDVSFPERSSGDAIVAQLWAQQRVADLITELRVEGARKTLIAQIVEIATRFGIVTPYTSYLAEEPVIAFEAEAAAEAVAEQAAAAPASGADAVQAAGSVEDLRGGDFELGADRVRLLGDRSFILRDGVWTDTGYDGSEPQEVSVGSPQFASLVEARADLLAASALGPVVIAAGPDRWVRITWPDAGSVDAVTLPQIDAPAADGGNGGNASTAANGSEDTSSSGTDGANGDPVTSDTSGTDGTGANDTAPSSNGSSDSGGNHPGATNGTDATGSDPGPTADTAATAIRNDEDDGGISSGAWAGIAVVIALAVGAAGFGANRLGRRQR